jgi:putative addiction module component (TIGR02574 family)
MSAETLIHEASKLSAADRVRIAEALWQSAWDEQADLPITAEQREELDRRLADYDANPSAGDDWSTVRARLEKNL